MAVVILTAAASNVVTDASREWSACVYGYAKEMASQHEKADDIADAAVALCLKDERNAKQTLITALISKGMAQSVANSTADDAIRDVKQTVRSAAMGIVMTTRARTDWQE